MRYQCLPTTQAMEYCLGLREELETTGFLDKEKTVSTDSLYEPYGGRMLGVLVCKDALGNEVVLKAFSGQYQGRWLVAGWVGPVLDPYKFDQVIEANDDAIHALSQVEGCDEERRRLTHESLERIFSLYRFSCADGIVRSFSDMGWKNPPSGTGDCCAPKLLHAAFSQDLHPLSMAECFFGASNRSGSKLHGQFYPPCQERCQPLLRHMLGLDILYCDEYIAVVNKPPGLLSVPGKGEEHQDCLEARLRRLFPSCIDQPAVHRLDMDTSGLLVLAFDRESHRNLNIQFMNGNVKKEYIALLDGIVKEQEGSIQLSFRLDVENRPRQIYDEVQGKLGLTQWKRLRVEPFCDGRTVTRILFLPQTGRTHQLRVHSAHALGLGFPIVGDRLYGTREAEPRMYLHASRIEFDHPVSKRRMVYEASPQF